MRKLSCALAPAAWTTTLAYDLTNLPYDRSGNRVTSGRNRDAGTLVDNLT
jgi:hypothetical protein